MLSRFPMPLCNISNRLSLLYLLLNFLLSTIPLALPFTSYKLRPYYAQKLPLPYKFLFASLRFFFSIPIHSAPMDSSAAQRLLCSSCSRPCQSPLYRTCDGCRQKWERHKCRSRPLETAGSPTMPPLLHSATLIVPSPRTFCSQCIQPWHSPRYKICDVCRQKAKASYRHRFLPTTDTERLPSIDPLDNITQDFSGPASQRRRLMFAQ